MKKTLLLALAVCAASLASAQTDNPKAILDRVNKVRDDGRAQMQKTGDYKGYSKLMDQVHQMVRDALKTVDPAKVEAKDAYDWAQLYDMVDEHKTVCDLTHAYLSTHPDAESTFKDKMLMMQNCNALGEADMLQSTLTSTRPVKSEDQTSLALNGCEYVDTIASKKGAKEGLHVLDQLQKAVKLPDPKLVAEERLKAEKAKPGSSADLTTGAPTDDAKLKQYQNQADQMNQEAGFEFANERAKLLQEEGRHSQAVDAIKAFEAATPKLSTGIKHMADMSLVQYQITGQPAVELKADRTVGSFASLGALKGKVVLVDFFAHWCGPCMASVPSMVSMYGDLHDKGLEIVGVTELYGFYQSERNLSKDQEFAKLTGMLSDKKMTWPVVVGQKDNNNAYGIWGIPESVLIDKKGVVRNVWVGYDPAQEDKIRQTVEALLKE